MIGTAARMDAAEAAARHRVAQRGPSPDRFVDLEARFARACFGEAPADPRGGVVEVDEAEGRARDRPAEHSGRAWLGLVGWEG